MFIHSLFRQIRNSIPGMAEPSDIMNNAADGVLCRVIDFNLSNKYTTSHDVDITSAEWRNLFYEQRRSKLEQSSSIYQDISTINKLDYNKC